MKDAPTRHDLLVRLVTEWLDGDGPVKPPLTASSIVAAVTAAYLQAPVQQRMEAMGMEPAVDRYGKSWRFYPWSENGRTTDEGGFIVPPVAGDPEGQPVWVEVSK